MATPELHASCSASRWSNFAFRLSFSSIRSLSEPIFIWIHRPCWLDTNHRVLQPNSRCCKRRILCLRMHACVTKTGPPRGRHSRDGMGGVGTEIGSCGTSVARCRICHPSDTPSAQYLIPRRVGIRGKKKPLETASPGLFRQRRGGWNAIGRRGRIRPDRALPRCENVETKDRKTRPQKTKLLRYKGRQRQRNTPR